MCVATTPRKARKAYLYGWSAGHGWEATAMPTYAYRCKKCGESFEHVETISEHGTTKPSCPKCGSDKVASVPTAFVAMTGKKS
jgi:putative FmdB family regulatory protein